MSSLIVLALIGALMFFAPIAGVFLGAISGWIVGLFFEDSILGALELFIGREHGITMWQLGAFLGFVGGYFKTTVRTNGK